MAAMKSSAHITTCTRKVDCPFWQERTAENDYTNKLSNSTWMLIRRRLSISSPFRLRVLTEIIVVVDCRIVVALSFIFGRLD
jgi:hypothetical protein